MREARFLQRAALVATVAASLAGCSNEEPCANERALVRRTSADYNLFGCPPDFDKAGITGVSYSFPSEDAKNKCEALRTEIARVTNIYTVCRTRLGK